jgi:hypothetical protein
LQYVFFLGGFVILPLVYRMSLLSTELIPHNFNCASHVLLILLKSLSTV